MKSLRYVLPLLVFGVLAGFLLKGLDLNPREVPSPLIGKPAPAFELPRLDNAAQRLRRDELIGKPWVLNVWASWCGPCKQEHPLVVDLARRYPHIPVYGLNYKDQGAAATQWLAQLGNPYAANLVDADGRVGIDYGVYGVPETFVMDAQGIIRLKHIGPLTEQAVRERIEPLLRQLGS
jgi:cytochrome c biogenesis protein CcmG/thiol:disulfide interchange protein DsbE